jgi:hypothetical protein
MSSSSSREVFLSNNNREYLYRNVCDLVQQETNNNLNDFNKYRQSFPDMMQKVYENAESSVKNNVAALNRQASNKISKYFISQITTKKNAKSNQNNYNAPLIERPSRANNLGYDQVDLDSRMNNIQHERNLLTTQPVQRTSGGLPNQISVQSLESKGETDKRYQELLAARDAELPVQNNSVNPIIGHPQPSDQAPMKVPPRPNINLNVQSQSQTNDFKILPYTISDDFNEQSINLDHPLYINADEIANNTVDGTDGRYMELQQIRNNEIRDFLTYQQSTTQQQPIQNPNQIRENFKNQALDRNVQQNQPIENFKNLVPDKSQMMSNYINERSDVERFHSTRNETDVNPVDIYRTGNDKFERNSNALTVNKSQEERDAQSVREFEESSKLMKGNPIFDFFLNQINNSKREYYERPHYIVVSSEDRKWENDVENRYNFVVNFNSSDSQTGASIDTLYRNIVSIEVLKVIFPHDRLSVPFDNRIYLDLQSYPFLIMDIDEIEGVYRGSNSTLNEAFALLLFDKAFDCDILTSDQIPNSLSTTDTIKKRFTRQFTRGYMSYCPFLFEKKRYFINPIASLNRLSIKFLRPDGQYISNDKDHLLVDSITYDDVLDNFELTATGGFPRSTSGKYIRISTTTYFSNRTFRIGDIIKIRNYTMEPTNDDERKFLEFINRERGHVIVNLDQEYTGTDSTNEGFINSMFISPPGEIDYKSGALNEDTYYEVSPPAIDGNCYLINTSMQIHITFKIITRDEKSESIIKPSNV